MAGIHDDWFRLLLGGGPLMIRFLNHKNRAGVVQIEVVVAGILLFALISIVPSLGYHLNRIQKESLQYQIAVQTLANELDRLRALDPSDPSRLLQNLPLPSYISDRLPNATMRAVTMHDALGLRVQLSMQWERVGNPPPVEMVGWLDARPKPSAREDSQ